MTADRKNETSLRQLMWQKYEKERTSDRHDTIPDMTGQNEL